MLADNVFVDYSFYVYRIFLDFAMVYANFSV